jgi:signal peptidase I
MNKVKEYFHDLWPYLLILVIVIVIKFFVITPIKVNGPSMNPTLKDGDIMILDEISYRFKKIKRFDIVVVKYKNENLIKRVIGLPGEKISYQGDKLYINGKYIKENFTHKLTNDFTTITIAKNSYFVMGDNRPNSMDSRIIGTIPKSSILGKTSFTIIPFNRWGSKN